MREDFIKIQQHVSTKNSFFIKTYQNWSCLTFTPTNYCWFIQQQTFKNVKLGKGGKQNHKNCFLFLQSRENSRENIACHKNSVELQALYRWFFVLELKKLCNCAIFKDASGIPVFHVFVLHWVLLLCYTFVSMIGGGGIILKLYKKNTEEA